MLPDMLMSLLMFVPKAVFIPIPALLLSALYLFVSCRLSMLRFPPVSASTLLPLICEPIMLVSSPLVMCSLSLAVTVLFL